MLSFVILCYLLLSPMLYFVIFCYIMLSLTSWDNNNNNASDSGSEARRGRKPGGASYVMNRDKLSISPAERGYCRLA